MTLSSRIRYWIYRTSGFDVRHFDFMHAPVARRMALLKHYDVSSVFDVGANEGQYASELRRYGYTGRIVSFEPLAAEYKILSRRAGRDAGWKTVNTALGDRPGTATIHVGRFRQCSSLLEVVPDYAARDEASQQIASETISVNTLDAAAAEHLGPRDRLFVKADVQGFEQHVVEGASKTLPQIVGFQLELSFEPVYAGTPLFPEMVAYMREKGFVLRSIEPVNCSDIGAFVQVDGLFFRESPAA